MKRMLASLVLVAAALAGCAKNSSMTGLQGHLLIIGGGLDDDNKPVYERFITLASQASPDGVPRIVIATAASGDQEANDKGKRESIGAYSAIAKIDCIRRETSTEETVALIDQASAIFFTGGDQKRITTRYRPDPAQPDSPELAAMRRLLARGGVIAGTSAGDAMMSDPMFHTGRSAEALGIASNRKARGEDDDADDKNPAAILGPRIGHGMGFLPWAFTDSHFFERNRVGRLVAAQEVSGRRLGIGVGEDACVEVDLATGNLIGISVADSLLVDIGSLQRDGLQRSDVLANVITKDEVVNIVDLLAQKPVAPQRLITKAAMIEVPTVEPGQNRQLASWRFFCRASEPQPSMWQLKLDGWQMIGWPAHLGWAAFDVGPLPPK